MKTLCLYYTRTNKTREIMENIAKIIGADVAEYTDGKDRSGFLGYIVACFATVNSTISKVTIKGEINVNYSATSNRASCFNDYSYYHISP